MSSKDSKSGQINYSAKDIEVLEGLEPVRKRPGMYIGGTDQAALHHMFVEILDNSMDEAVAGFASIIDVKVDAAANSITITDNGRGIPIDPHPKFPNKSALEVIMTTLHSGGKFNTNVYATSGGLHGVGVSVVNALSSQFVVQVKRDGFKYTQSYKQGTPLTTLGKEETKERGSGTSITFIPDPEIFGDIIFDPKSLYSIARSKAYLYKGVKIKWNFDDGAVAKKQTESADAEATQSGKKSQVIAQEVIHYPNGLKDFVAVLTNENTLLGDDIFYAEVELEGKAKVECAFTWVEDGETIKRFYCNTIYNPLGGSHEQGMRAALLKSFKQYAELLNMRSFSKVTADDIFIDIVLVLSVFIPNPIFQGQTKDKLLSKEATRAVESALKDRIDNWLAGNPHNAKRLLEFIQAICNERLQKKVSKEIERKNPLKSLRLPGKLTDCSIKNSKESEIFLVEGESAGGTAKQARDRKTQAILPLKGKILNVANSSVEKINANQEISDLIYALGCGSGHNFDLDKLRYGKVIIMTDADVDGAHICSLLLTFFFLKMPRLIRDGYLYLAKPPLYKIKHKEKQMYVHSDAEKDTIVKQIQASSRGNPNIEISRFKGLGEMTAVQLRDTTMNINTRTLYKVSLAEEDLDTASMVKNLMGKNPEHRFNFIKENAHNCIVD